MALDPQQIKAIQEATGHSVFGSSSLPRIVSCPASVGMELRAGIKPTSIYASKGAALHHVTETSLRAADPHDYVYSLKSLSVEDTAYVIDAVDYVFDVIAKHEGVAVFLTPGSDGYYDRSEVDSLVAQGKVVVMLEASGSLASYGVPESYGTSDVVILSLKRKDIIDHKFGHGVAVYAKDNYQLIGYLGMAVPYIDGDVDDARMYVHINQPTLNIFDEWEVERTVLYQMILGDIYDAVSLAKGDDPPYGPSPKACRFCGANKGCRERHKSLVGQAKLVQQMARNPTEVSNEQWAVFLEAAASLKLAISQVEEYAVAEIQAGKSFPGFKLVASKANRKFVDEEAGAEYIKMRLGKRAYKDPELVSLAQAEKLDKSLKNDEKWASLIFTPKGAPKLARVSEKGDALVYGVQGLMQRMASGDA